MSHKVLISLGSNVGDRKQFLDKAVALIRSNCGTVSKLSSIYETAAWGNQDQSAFLNQVLELHSPSDPIELLHTLLKIEISMGRRRQVKWEARVIDLDILLFENKVIETEELQIPHPLLHQRRFCLEPMNEIAPDWVHPVLNKSIHELLLNCSDSLLVKKWNENF